MIDEHYIVWVAMETNLGKQRKLLNPGDKPMVQFALLDGEEVVAVYEHCNLHGLYKA